MLRIVLLILGMSLGVSAQAGVNDVIGGVIDILRPGHGDGYGGGYGGARCTAHDRKWEEHFGGHRSCEECERRHGRCVEVCEYLQVECVAVGTRWGRPAEFEGYGNNRREARWRALENCERRGGRNCYADPRRCREQSNQESRPCFGGGGGHGGGHGGGWGGGRGPRRP